MSGAEPPAGSRVEPRKLIPCLRMYVRRSRQISPFWCMLLSSTKKGWFDSQNNSAKNGSVPVWRGVYGLLNPLKPKPYVPDSTTASDRPPVVRCSLYARWIIVNSQPFANERGVGRSRLGQRRSYEHIYVGPTLAANIGPTLKYSLAQRWPKVKLPCG